MCGWDVRRGGKREDVWLSCSNVDGDAEEEAAEGERAAQREEGVRKYQFLSK